MVEYHFTPQCVATTGDAFCREVEFRNPSSTRLPKSNCFRSAQFSADGTSIITHNDDQRLRTFVLPTDLLDARNEPQVLSPYSDFQAGSNIQAYTLYPHFNLQDPASTLVLSASADVPITLRNAFQLEAVQSQYMFVNAKTEEHRRPTSLAFTRDGRHFLAGSNNVLAVFDCHRNGEGPILQHRLKHSTKSGPHHDTWSLSQGGLVSAISISSQGAVAIGTWNREIALFERESLGECASAFSLDNKNGTGITDLKWSPDGTYLLAAERSTDTIQVYDVRYQRKLLASLNGRAAETTQKLGIDLIPTATGYEVWAGDTDGILRMWSNPGSTEGDHTADAIVPDMHQAPISSTAWHPSGAVLATCSGRDVPRESKPLRIDEASSSDSDSDSDSDSSDDASSDSFSDMDLHPEVIIPDNTLKIWSV